MIDFNKITAFDWDEGNARKSGKQDVSMGKAEEVFFNVPLLVLEVGVHRQQEARFYALGRTNIGRALQITFTLRQSGAWLRIISAKDMYRKEREVYERAN